MDLNMNDLKEKLGEISQKTKNISEILNDKGDKVGLYSKIEWENLKGEYDGLKKNVEGLIQKYEETGKGKLEKAGALFGMVKSTLGLESLSDKYNPAALVEKIDSLKKASSVLFEKFEMIGKVRAEKFGKELDDTKSKAELEALSLKYEFQGLIEKVKTLAGTEKEENKEENNEENK